MSSPKRLRPLSFRGIAFLLATLLTGIALVFAPTVASAATVPGQLEATGFVVAQGTCDDNGLRTLTFGFDFTGGPDSWQIDRDPLNDGATVASGAVATTTGNVTGTTAGQPAGQVEYALYGSRGGKPAAKTIVLIGDCTAAEPTNPTPAATVTIVSSPCAPNVVFNVLNRTLISPTVGSDSIGVKLASSRGVEDTTPDSIARLASATLTSQPLAIGQTVSFVISAFLDSPVGQTPWVVIGNFDVTRQDNCVGAAPTPTHTPGIDRIAGIDRYATAIAASTQAYPTRGSAGAVVLARGDDYPDALVGTPLAKAHNAPLLLTTGATLPAALKTEIQRAVPAGGKVYLLGGNGAIPAGFDAQLTNLGFTPVRYAGADRYATALAVAHALGDPSTVLLATGTNFPDALAAGTAAAHLGGAVLLTKGTAMATGDSAYLAAHPGQVYAVGGPAAAADRSATPLVGADRYATAASVATRFFTAPTTVGVATGADFPDALSGSALLAGKDAPILLATAASLPSDSTTYLTSVKSSVKTAYIFGGTAVVSAAVAAVVGTALR